LIFWGTAVIFEVYNNGSICKDFTLYGACVFGVDRIPLRNSASIKFKQGRIECRTRNNEPAGISLLWPVEGFGNILLHTTRLPDRPRPYILNVELARAKLMEITMKREDWAVFEQTPTLAKTAGQAQQLFIEALQNINDPAKASTLADKSLQKALDFSEKLTTRHAELLFEARRKSRGFTRSSLGCGIDPRKLTSKNYLKGVLELFAHIAIPVNWATIETSKGEYDFSHLDSSIEAFAQKRLVLCAGPLLCFSADYLPKWLLESRPQFEQIRDAAYKFVSKVVTRYARHIHTWKTITGMNAYNYFRFGFDRILEITRTACLAAREADNRSLKIIEIVSPWGEYYADNPDTVPPWVYLDMVTQAGINFDAVGVQLIFGKNKPGMYVRDMMQISAMLDRFAAVPKPLHITSVAVPDSSKIDGQRCEHAGMWHKPWDQNVQAEWLERFYRIALSKPFVNTVTYHSLADTEDDYLIGAGLLTEKMEPKKSFMTVARLQKQILHKT